MNGPSFMRGIRRAFAPLRGSPARIGCILSVALGAQRPLGAPMASRAHGGDLSGRPLTLPLGRKRVHGVAKAAARDVPRSAGANAAGQPGGHAYESSPRGKARMNWSLVQLRTPMRGKAKQSSSD